MNDTVTTLTTATGKYITKAFRGSDYQAVQFNPGSEFLVAQTPVHNLESLAAVISDVETEPTKAIIRGSLIKDPSGPVPRNKDTFASLPRQWCMIDIDSLAWDGAFDDQQALVAHAVQHLPNEFQSSKGSYHFSSSMSIKAGIRVHLWYWLERPCSDDELKAWLSGYPVDMSLFNPIQIHLTANPRFIEGATDPFPQRSGMFEAGNGLSTVLVPIDLAARTARAKTTSKQRTHNKAGMLDPATIIRDPETGRVIDGREQLMFLLSNEVMRELVTTNHIPNEQEVTEALWKRFCEEADISRVSGRGAWTIADAEVKARARLLELADGIYDFVSRSDRTTLVAGSGKVERPKLIGATQAQDELSSILDEFFEGLADGASPRAAIRLTMGT